MIWISFLEALVLLGCVQKSVYAGEGRQVSGESLRELSQKEVELILGAQTTLRRHFIRALAVVQEKIVGASPFYSAIEGILRGLHSRDLDPLKSFDNGYTVDCNESAAYRTATIVYSLQNCNSRETTFNDWHLFLRTIPKINAIVPPPPNVHLTPHHIHKANTDNTPFVIRVLLSLHHNHLTPTATLLRHLLFNYRYRHHSPDIDVAVQALDIDESALKTDPTATRPNDMLSGILRSLPRHHEEGPLSSQADILLSALSNTENVAKLRMSTLWELFTLITEDEYPSDIVSAATELSAVVKSRLVSIDPTLLLGYPPLERLLSVVAQMTTTAHALSQKVLAVYPHVKLKFLSHEQKYFHPRTSSDVAFLLDSFLTTSSGRLVRQVLDIFRLPHFHWQKVLETFDYSKYSRPRSLLLDMLRELSRRSSEVPFVFDEFVKENSEVSDCLPQEIAEVKLDSPMAHDERRTDCPKNSECSPVVSRSTEHTFASTEQQRASTTINHILQQPVLVMLGNSPPPPFFITVAPPSNATTNPLLTLSLNMTPAGQPSATLSSTPPPPQTFLNLAAVTNPTNPPSIRTTSPASEIKLSSALSTTPPTTAITSAPSSSLSPPAASTPDASTATDSSSSATTTSSASNPTTTATSIAAETDANVTTIAPPDGSTSRSRSLKSADPSTSSSSAAPP